MSQPKQTGRSSILALLSLAALVSMASMRVCDPLLPMFANDFGVFTGSAAQTISAFAIVYGLMQLFYGPLGDRYGKTRVITCAVTCCALFNVTIC
jgi:predicted MFS family arabinose efflux permease